MNKTDWKPIVQRAIDLGWIHKRKDKSLSTDQYIYRMRAEGYRARGLGSTGKAKTPPKHPHLQSLSSRAQYQREYMRMWRNRK